MHTLLVTINSEGKWAASEILLSCIAFEEKKF